MKLQTKIAISLGPFVLLVLAAIFAFNYTLIHRILSETALQEIRKTEKSMYRAVQVQLSTAINNYLRGITEHNLEYIHARYQEYLSGKLTEEQAKNAVAQHFSEQKVGSSGYPVAVLRKEGRLYLRLHPYQQGLDCTHTQGCGQWDTVKNGYLEYSWKNPEDDSERKKAAFVREFKPWHWIIGSSSYRDEFVDLVNIQDLTHLLAPMRINRTGYFALFDQKGKLLLHPQLYKFRNSETFQDQVSVIFNRLKESKNGYLTYEWKNPSDLKPRSKYAFIERLEDFNWYLVATGYHEEINEPFQPVRNITLMMIAGAGLLLFFLFFRLSRQLTSPLIELEQGIKDFDEEKIRFRWQKHNINEINVLGNAFARLTTQLIQMIDKLKTSNRQLAHSEEENRNSRTLVESTIDSMPSIIIGVDAQLHITLWNRTAEDLTGLPRSQVEMRPLAEAYPEMEKYLSDLAQSLAINKPCVIPTSIVSADGTTRFNELTIYPLLSHGMKGAVLRIDDISERVEMEKRLRQSQKMDAIGHLAGGMAHDFNNMLGGILGAADALQLRLGEQEQPLIQNIRVAAQRSGELIRNLLAFARKEHIALAPVSLGQMIRETVEILRRTLDKRIIISYDLTSSPTEVLGDGGQLQSALMNLGINAGQAMSAGGSITYRTSIRTLDPLYCELSPFSLIPGQYVKVEIEDTGSGIKEEHVKRIFEPFFTTKNEEQGTGLGLAAVYGTMQQHSGEILVDSTWGKGTTFTLLFPLHEVKESEEAPADDQLFSGAGDILVIDDEPVIRLAVRFMLEELGYTVHEAENGKKGVEYYQEHTQKIDLILLDMVMPVMDGNECFRLLKEINPQAKIVIASGYTREADFGSLTQKGLAGFIRKPYTLEQLVALLKELLKPMS